MRVVGSFVVALVLGAALAGSAQAQSSSAQSGGAGVRVTQGPSKGEAKQDRPSGSQQRAPGVQGAPVLPGTTQLTLLIQSAMAAVGQANATGNYTVLHALAAPSFQQANPPDKLSQIFEGLRKARVDITPVLLFQPILTAQPSISAQGMLRLTGYYRTQPQNVLFDLLYVQDAGQWLLHGVSINTRPDQPTGNQPPPQAAPAKSASPPAAKK
jgi:hypothetical protein